jgi:hypothetical protein
MDTPKIKRTTADRAPDSDLEALMQAKPFEEPEQSVEGLLELRDAVAAIVDQLDERSLWVVNACISEGKSLQAIADELGMTKTHVWRIRNQAFNQLRGVMAADTTIRKHIRLADTWEQSASQWVGFLSDNRDEHPISIEALMVYRDALADYLEADPKNIEHAYILIAKRTIALLRKMELWDSGYMISTLCKKQHDYGHGNINRFGLMGITVRLSDKVERYANLEGRQAQNEATTDTLIDIVGYCVIALMLLDETFQLDLGDDYGTDTGHN